MVGGNSQAPKKKGAKSGAKQAPKKGKGKTTGKKTQQVAPGLEPPLVLDKEEPEEVPVKPRPKPWPLTGPRPPSMWEAEPLQFDLLPTAPTKGNGSETLQMDGPDPAPVADADEGGAEGVVSKP